MSAFVMPVPEPPDTAVAELLELIAFARAELADAHRTITMLAADAWSEFPGWEMRRIIESSVAERRAELWTKQLAELEQKLRAGS